MYVGLAILSLAFISSLFALQSDAVVEEDKVVLSSEESMVYSSIYRLLENTSFEEYVVEKIVLNFTNHGNSSLYVFVGPRTNVTLEVAPGKSEDILVNDWLDVVKFSTKEDGGIRVEIGIRIEGRIYRYLWASILGLVLFLVGAGFTSVGVVLKFMGLED